MNESALLKKASSKKVLFCGENIVDVYHYVSPLGRPTKDAILSVEQNKTETFQGGITAAGKHAQDLCKSIDYYVGGQTIRKERYVEQSHFHKLFQVYIADAPRAMPLPDLAKYDAVVVIDYGHGMANEQFINKLFVLGTKYLAINVQTNSGNYGYNLCTKYPRADYLCIDESEARLATQNRTGLIEDSLRTLSAMATKTVITLGKKGAIGCEAGKTYHCPAFTDSVVDTMGAGDAFFAITALVAEDADIPSLLRIGNAAGAIKSQIVGHRGSVTRNDLAEYLDRVR